MPQPRRSGSDGLSEHVCWFGANQQSRTGVTALGAFDPEVNAALSERGSWRPDAISALLQRLPPRANAEDTLALLNVLTSFEAYDALATPQRPRNQVVLMLQRAATQLLGA